LEATTRAKWELISSIKHSQLVNYPKCERTGFVGHSQAHPDTEAQSNSESIAFNFSKFDDFRAGIIHTQDVSSDRAAKKHGLTAPERYVGSTTCSDEHVE